MRNLIFLSLVIAMFIMGCNAFLIAGILPQISQTISQPIAITGQGITAFSLFYFLSAPFFSVIYANKSFKLIIQMALIIFLIGNIVTLFSKTLVIFLVGRALAGVATGIFTPACLTMAFHFADQAGRGKRLSMIWGANSAGAVFGVPFGIYLASVLNWQFSIACIISISLLILVLISLQNIEIALPNSPSIKDRIFLLMNQKILLIIAITFLIATASLGLYSYLSIIHVGVTHSLAIIVFFWGLGGFMGSSFVGFFIDYTKKPQMIMSIIIIGLILMFLSIPVTQNLNYLGLLPFFIWGIFGWAMPTAQQHILFELNDKQGSLLAALNGSAIGFGNAVGTAMGGVIIAAGSHPMDLLFYACIILLVAFLFQLLVMKYSEGVMIRE